MSDIIVLLMDLTLIVFAVYGTFVSHKWHKLEKKTEVMLDELRREMEQES